MAVAWIGNRGVLVADAVEHAAELLLASRCPVFTFDTDVHGTRATIALAARVGAAYDHIGGEALARETALFTDRGGMFVAPGEVCRRADVVAIVGELPSHHHEFVARLAETAPELDGKHAGTRTFFMIGAGAASLPIGGDGTRMTPLTCGNADLNGTLAAIRAQCAGRNVSTPVANIDRFAEALARARFAVFVVSGYATDSLGLDMLQGLVSDIGRKKRASAVHLPAHENGWGSTLVSTWTTGFPLRTAFRRGVPQHDSWRWNAARMITDGEADLQLWMSASGQVPPVPRHTCLIVLAKTLQPADGAAVTIAIGEPGVDHDAVSYASRTATFAAVAAQAASNLPSAAAIIRSMVERLPEGAQLPC
jgi:formylmethanofuran dehydrogenase subunit B